jgi:uncharacterized protein YciI
MPIYAVELRFDQDDSYRLQVRPAHRAYLAELTAAGSLRLAGPIADGDGALLVYDVADRAGLDAALAADPYFAGEQDAASVASVREWSVLDLGSPTADAESSDPELDDLLDSLARHRGFLRQTIEGLTDAQAGERPTASALCVGGLIKHVGATERSWVEFAVHGEQPGADEIDWSTIDWENPSPEVAAMMAAREEEFSMTPQDTVQSVLAGYEEVAAETERVLRTLDLEATHLLPDAPWNAPGTRWSVRRVVLHIIAETAQHSGHADILRESIDGAKTMG